MQIQEKYLKHHDAKRLQVKGKCAKMNQAGGDKRKQELKARYQSRIKTTNELYLTKEDTL